MSHTSSFSCVPHGHTAAARGHCRVAHSIHTKTRSPRPSEAQEEAGIDPSKFLVRDVFSDDHGPWRYDTVIAHAQGEIGAFEANAESDDLQWVALSSVETFELHAGLAGAWPQLHERVLSTL